MRIILFYCFLIFSTIVTGQKLDRLHVPFEFNNGSPIINALAGGLHAPQFLPIDLNNDKRKDLLIFDRLGFILLPFINDGSTEGENYHYAPEMIKFFPKNLVEFVSIGDYNGDGIEDIFSTSVALGIPGVSVFKGSRDDNGLLHFTVEKDVLRYPSQSNGFMTNIPLLSIDYPSIVDADFDGDLDILTFGIGGGNIEFYRNYSVERKFGMDSLIFELEDNCWGGVYESGISSEIELASNIGECASDFTSKPSQSRHAGSSLAAIDLNNDRAIEMAIGDVSFPKINMLSNGGTKKQAFITAQDTNFPSYDRPIEIDVFPTAFFLDINNDDKVDLIAGNNTANGLEDYNCAWQYKNTGTQEAPIFEFEKKNFMVGQMIDFGSSNHPVFVDVNNDGLEDLIIGTNGRYQANPDNKDDRLIYFKNVGTKTNPKFKLTDQDWIDFSEFAEDNSNFAPCFGDLDNDGDLDMIVGSYSGVLFYGENTAEEGKPMKFDNITKDYLGIDVGLLSTPTLLDLNGDGTLDLIVGERNSNINYFQNQGSLESPSFNNNQETEPNTQVLGNVHVKKIGYLTGYSSPTFIKSEGKLQLICGSQNSGLLHYNDIENNIYGDFNLVTKNYGEIQQGDNLNPIIADINNDGKYDLMVGNKRGGVGLFETAFINPLVSNEQIVKTIEFKLFPNPTSNKIWIDLGANTRTSDIQIINTLGQTEKEFRGIKNHSQLDLNGLSQGSYFVKVTNEEGIGVRKMVIQ